MYLVIKIIWIILRKYFIMETDIISKESTNKTKSNSNELSSEYSGLDVQHNKLDIGGPTSAFSSLYSHAVSNKDTGKNQTYGVHNYEDISKFEHQALQTNFFQEKKSGIFQDIPVAPAFVQICKYRFIQNYFSNDTDKTLINVKLKFYMYTLKTSTLLLKKERNTLAKFFFQQKKSKK